MVFVGDLLDDLGRYDGLHDEVGRLHLPHSLTVGDDIPQEDQTGLVAVDQHPFALAVLAGHADTVCIRVGSHQNISVKCLRITQSEGQCLRNLRIRTVDGREVSILHHLLLHTVDIVKTP